MALIFFDISEESYRPTNYFMCIVQCALCVDKPFAIGILRKFSHLQSIMYIVYFIYYAMYCKRVCVTETVLSTSSINIIYLIR